MNSNMPAGAPLKVSNGASNYCIMPRDFTILRALEDFRILSLEQVWAAFFGLGSCKAQSYLFLKEYCPCLGHINPAYQRLRMMAKLGYVEHNYRPRFPHVYRLTAGGHALLRGQGLAAFKSPCPWPTNIRHSLISAGLGLFFVKVLGLSVKPERKLLSEAWPGRKNASSANEKPLADLHVSNADTEYRIEVELSQKSDERYLELWGKLGEATRQDMPHVLYTVDDSLLAGKLLRLTRSGYFPGIYIGTIEDICRDWTGAVWRNFEGAEFRFKEKQ